MGNVYTNNGFLSRDEYLLSLADEYGVPEEVVYSLADSLGPTEDFDGLPSVLQDYHE